MKLQDAFFSEKNKYGGWTLIGYSAPGGSQGASSQTNNFEYSTSGAIATNSEETAGNKIGWQAKNLAKLNDCTVAADNWTIKLGTISSTTTVSSYEAKVKTDQCKTLTPSFEQIGK